MATTVIEERPPLELTFWRVLSRYLLSIVASLACGGAWWLVAVRWLNLVPHLGLAGTIATGVLALALGFLAMGCLWLRVDLARPVPEGVDPEARNLQLFALWLGIPLGVLLVLAVFAGLAAIVSVVVRPVG